MERLVRRRSNGITAAGLRKWGTAFLLAGVISRTVLQNNMLGMVGGTTEQLLDLFTNNPQAMSIAAVALALQALETCAVPIFSFLLVEGVLHAENFQEYFLKILSVAVVTEIPYNLAIGGKLLDLSDRNPVFGMVLGLIIMHFYHRYSEKGFKNLLIKLLVTVAAFVWCGMLKIQYGECIVLLVAMLWMCRNKPNLRMLFGCSAAMGCSIFSPFFMASPMAFLAVHYYNGEPGEQSEVMRFWVYPAILAVLGTLGYLLF